MDNDIETEIQEIESQLNEFDDLKNENQPDNEHLIVSTTDDTPSEPKKNIKNLIMANIMYISIFMGVFIVSIICMYVLKPSFVTYVKEMNDEEVKKVSVLKVISISAIISAASTGGYYFYKKR